MYSSKNSLIILGEPKKGIKEQIEKLISLKQKSSFIKNNLSQDIEIIKKLYASIGYNFAQIDTKIREIDDRNVDLVFEVIRGNQTKISKISTRFYNANGQWLYTPKHWTAMITLENGANLSNKEMIGNNGKIVLSEMLVNSKDYLAKKIVLLIPSYGTIPDGLQGAGNKAWTFIDEIVVE